MHSGFVPLRSECGMNLHRPIRPVTLSPDAKANVTRIEEIWRECRARYGAKGPFLFGGFGAADAMYAPVVHRLRTYAIDVAPDTKAYMETMMALPAFQQWTREGLAETLVIDRFEDA
jgi:glutathione S-transferase